MSLPEKNVTLDASAENETINIISQNNLRIPQFWPQKIALWFRLLEAQFASARITKDNTKFNVVIANLGEKYVEQVEDVVMNPPAVEKYEHLKNEVIKRLTESDSSRVRKLLESEEIGDRTPSQFFRDLRKLTTPSIPDDFVITLWKTRLPASTQRVLAASADTNVTAIVEMADRIHEIKLEQERITAVAKDAVSTEMQAAFAQLTLKIDAIEKTQRRFLSRTHERNRPRSRSRGRRALSQGGSDQEGICWYHQKFQNNATKCRPPCKWKAGNEESRP
ncbi:hypothetical protein CAJAP_06981 [Camponotus japonicus]